MRFGCRTTAVVPNSTLTAGFRCAGTAAGRAVVVFQGTGRSASRGASRSLAAAVQSALQVSVGAVPASSFSSLPFPRRVVWPSL